MTRPVLLKVSTMMLAKTGAILVVLRSRSRAALIIQRLASNLDRLSLIGAGTVYVIPPTLTVSKAMSGLAFSTAFFRISVGSVKFNLKEKTMKTYKISNLY